MSVCSVVDAIRCGSVSLTEEACLLVGTVAPVEAMEGLIFDRDSSRT